MAQLEEMPDYYKPQPNERRAAQLNTRVPVRLKRSLELLSEYWTARERLESGDDKIELSLGDVVVRLLGVGLEGAWEEAGIGSYPTEEAVEQLKRQVAKNSP